MKALINQHFERLKGQIETRAHDFASKVLVSNLKRGNFEIKFRILIVLVVRTAEF